MNPIISRSSQELAETEIVGSSKPILTAPEPVEKDPAFADHDLPPHLLRDLGPIRPITGDPILQRLAHLLRLHPEINREYSDIDLRRLSSPERLALLKTVESRLSIA